MFFIDVTIMILLRERKNMRIKKVQSAYLILACVAATGFIGCGKTDESLGRKATGPLKWQPVA